MDSTETTDNEMNINGEALTSCTWCHDWYRKGEPQTQHGCREILIGTVRDRMTELATLLPTIGTAEIGALCDELYSHGGFLPLEEVGQ